MKTNVFHLVGIAALAVVGQARAAVLAVCDRTPEVRDFIVQTTGRHDCKDVTEADLAQIKRIAVPNKRIAAFKVGDFSGLSAMEILNIKGNPFTQLPEGLFDGLTNLKTLVIFRTQLTRLPDDFLADTPNLENLHIFANPFKTISESVFSRLAADHSLKVLDFNKALNPPEQARLKAMFPTNGTVELNFY
jgi:hypothetical protein